MAADFGDCRCRAGSATRGDGPGFLAIAENKRKYSVGDYLAAYIARAEMHNAMPGPVANAGYADHRAQSRLPYARGGQFWRRLAQLPALHLSM
jgi:hypothetical protein